MAGYREKYSTSEDKKTTLTLQDDIAIGSDELALAVAGEIINASGHRDQLDRQYGILSICGMALTVDNAWVAIGTSLNVAICEFYYYHS